MTKLLHLPESLSSHLQDGYDASLLGLLGGLVGMMFVKILVGAFEMEISAKWMWTLFYVFILKNYDTCSKVSEPQKFTFKKCEKGQNFCPCCQQ